MNARRLIAGLVVAAALASAAKPIVGQGRQSRQAASQRIDAESTAKIKEYTQDPRIMTELVDHLPASDTVPTPLKFLGRIVGTPDELTYHKEGARQVQTNHRAADRSAQDQRRAGASAHQDGEADLLRRLRHALA